MTTGKKIKYVRNLRKMTQQELGVAVGLPEGTAANRIAQYESDYRIPQEDLLVAMAEVLNVNPINFIKNDPNSPEGIMQLFFWLDEKLPDAINLFSLVKTEKKNTIGISPKIVVAEYDCNPDYQPCNSPTAIWFNYGLVDDFMREWLKKKQELTYRLITNDEYLEWKLQWPNNCKI